MELHREEPHKASDAKIERKPKRFRIAKLEKRIAPSKGGKGSNNTCNGGNTCVDCTICCHVLSIDCSGGN